MQRIGSLCRSVLFVCLLLPSAAQAAISPELWQNYLEKAEPSPDVTFDAIRFPGKFMRDASADRSSFLHPWKFRSRTYELHTDDKRLLGSIVYDLALHSGDIEASVSRERVERGVSGFHYHIDQICAWLDEVFAGKRELPVRDSLVFMGDLFRAGIVTLHEGHFKPGGTINHVLAAAPGKKSLEDNLRHERLHVFWDEDPQFRQQASSIWEKLSESERRLVADELKQYAATPEVILEEWAVREAIRNVIVIPDL